MRNICSRMPNQPSFDMDIFPSEGYCNNVKTNNSEETPKQQKKQAFFVKMS